MRPSQTKGHGTRVSALVCWRTRQLSLVLKALLVADLCNWDQLVEVAETLNKCNSQESITERAWAAFLLRCDDRVSISLTNHVLFFATADFEKFSASLVALARHH